MQIRSTKTQPAQANSIVERFRAKVGPEPKCSKLDRYVSDTVLKAKYPPSLVAALGGAVIGGGASYLAGLGSWGIAAGTVAAAAGVGIAGLALETQAYQAVNQHGTWMNSMGFAQSVVESNGLQDGELKEFKDADVLVKDDKMLVRFNESGRYLLINNPGEKDEVSWDSEGVVRSTPLAGEGLWRLNQGIKTTGYEEYHADGFKDPFSYAPSKETEIILSDSGKLSIQGGNGSIRFPNGVYHYDLNAAQK